MRRGVAWKLGGAAAASAVRLVSLLAIARLLGPGELGPAALALAFWAIASVVTDLPFAFALVQREQIDEDDRSTAFWASTAWAAAVATAVAAGSGALAALAGDDAVGPLVAVLGFGVVAAGLASTQVALLTRELDFGALERIGVAAAAAGGATGVVLAAAGAGAWALVGSSLAASAATLLLVWRRSPWRPARRCSRAALRRLGGFASLLYATRVVAAVQRNADRLLVGRSLGPAAAGAYAVPAAVAAAPGARVVDPVRAVLFPALARLQGRPEELRDAWLRVTAVTVAVLGPLLLGLALAAEELLALVLSGGWAASGPVLRILALAALVSLAGSMNAVVLTALGRQRTVLAALAVTLAASAVGFAVGRRSGLEGAAAGWAGTAAALTPAYVAVTARALGLRVRETVAVLAAPAAGLLAMAAVALGASRFLLGPEPAALPHVLLVAAAAAVHVGVTLALGRELRADLRRLVRARDAGAPAPA